MTRLVDLLQHKFIMMTQVHYLKNSRFDIPLMQFLSCPTGCKSSHLRMWTTVVRRPRRPHPRSSQNFPKPIVEPWTSLPSFQKSSRFHGQPIYLHLWSELTCDLRVQIWKCFCGQIMPLWENWHIP